MQQIFPSLKPVPAGRAAPAAAAMAAAAEAFLRGKGEAAVAEATGPFLLKPTPAHFLLEESAR